MYLQLMYKMRSRQQRTVATISNFGDVGAQAAASVVNFQVQRSRSPHTSVILEAHVSNQSKFLFGLGVSCSL